MVRHILNTWYSGFLRNQTANASLPDSALGRRLEDFLAPRVIDYTFYCNIDNTGICYSHVGTADKADPRVYFSPCENGNESIPYSKSRNSLGNTALVNPPFM